MSITFQKRQKELKRKEKQRAKAERREQRKAAKRAAKDWEGTPPMPSSDTENIMIDTGDIRHEESSASSFRKNPVAAGGASLEAVVGDAAVAGATSWPFGH